MTRFLLAAVLATMCTPASTKPGPTLPDVYVPDPPPPMLDAGDPGHCPDARQHLVEMGCPPAEAYFGEWETTCAAKANGQAVADCILSKRVCQDARECEE